jgi:hypothetical protein
VRAKRRLLAGSGCPPSRTSCVLALASRRSARAAISSKHQKNTASANHPSTTYNHQPNVRLGYSRPLIGQRRCTTRQRRAPEASGTAALIPGRAECDGEWMIEDVGSTNGTRVNGQRINGCLTLRARARVGIGASILVWADAARQATRTPLGQTPMDERADARGRWRADGGGQSHADRRAVQRSARPRRRRRCSRALDGHRREGRRGHGAARAGTPTACAARAGEAAEGRRCPARASKSRSLLRVSGLPASLPRLLAGCIRGGWTTANA